VLARDAGVGRSQAGGLASDDFDRVVVDTKGRVRLAGLRVDEDELEHDEDLTMRAWDRTGQKAFSFEANAVRVNLTSLRQPGP